MLEIEILEDELIEENKEVKRLHKNASLVLSYGKPALLTLMGRGIGLDTVARILRRYDVLELEKSEGTLIKFLRDILKAELNYARTRRFWDKIKESEVLKISMCIFF